MEDQREGSPQTFLVNNFSFLQPHRKQDDRCAFKWVLNADRGFLAVAGLKKTTIVMYSISSKLKSAFSTIDKITADKLTSKLVGKSSPFRFCVNN